MAYQAKRRRGPNKPKAVPDGEVIPARGRPDIPQERANIPDDPEPQQTVAPARRRKRADIGGQHLKLKVPEREGYVRRWVNDVPGRIAMFEELAYDHVSEQGIKSDSPDSRVRRLVGTQAGGAPQYAYLMETPREEYEAGIAEKEEGRRPFEEAIRRGEDPLDNKGLTSKVQSHESFLR